MVAFHSMKCSCSLVALVGSLLALVLAVHLFLTPLFPYSLDHFVARRAQGSARSPISGLTGGKGESRDENLRYDVDFVSQFSENSHGAVAYRGAPWNTEIGRWLSGCDSVSQEIEIVESIGAKSCKNDCSSRGVCNRETGGCRCFHGYSGEGCSENLQLDCNLPSSPDRPYGPWIVSICPAYCDKTRAMCFCGEGTKYPYRPVAESCGFRLNLPSAPGKPRISDWTKHDLENVYTTNKSKHGWCNVDPQEAYANKVNFKEECDCKYDGLWGRFCETMAECSCVNQCSMHGYCRGGACQCDIGWYGIDCSIPSALSPIKEWPMWLRPSVVEVPDKANDGDDVANVKAIVKKKRPLVYVYDLPPEFNSHLLEGRHFKFECVNRIYTEMNRTLWTSQLYGAQMALYESILASPHRTLNGEEADYFFVPVLDSCIITRAADAPHLSLRKHMGLRSSLTLEFYKKAYEHIVHHYPYWNRSSGRDHIWFFAWDEGACYAPKEIWNSMMLVHWGNTNTKYNRSTTAYWADNWDNIPSYRRGNHPCFDPEKDLVLPAWKRPEPGAIRLKLWSRPRKERTTLFYFNGNLGSAYDNGRPEDTYSMGIRQKLAAEFGSTPDRKGKLGRQHTSNVIVTPIRSSNYLNDLASSIFCGVLPGDGWSGRMEDSILQGCIPVIIQDGIFLPYENFFNYKSFAVRITEDEIPTLIKVLQGFNETEVELMLANVRLIWQRFVYRDAILLEAQRQRKLFSDEEGWAVEFSKLGEDDAFSTFVQILHYKLHNDPWRRHMNHRKEYGLPKSCLRSTT
ncbi:putative glucuronoxylan glucuronosyltransferase F8H [Apostasia shenzhenica]|uniref:Putative glucuronoxylan glucuronosyltransferase F8H n=1 Tax=Apostasia shenzhenica TaxID=1088818 RepID=A0A2I0ADG9_9ASPA|nr:putative glucuronoxylan glucuronosyltransferase F8H [Apostasia shenzhenica]